MTDLLLEHFWDGIVIDPITNCWNWSRSLDKDRYGKFWNGKTNIQSHKFAYEVNNGKVKNGFQLDHLCRNPSCCNPKHLEVVTPKENILRGIGVTAKNSRKTHCPKGHPLKEPNLVKYALKLGMRTCKICKNISNVNSTKRVKLKKNQIKNTGGCIF